MKLSLLLLFTAFLLSSSALAEESMTGLATSQLGFNYAGELWVEGGRAIRLFNQKAVVVFEDGSTANYSEVQEKLRRDVEKNGTRRVKVYTSGNSFTRVVILPRTKK